jgi:hypothetical protein
MADSDPGPGMAVTASIRRPRVLRMTAAWLVAAGLCANAGAATPWPTTAFKVDFAPAPARSTPGQAAPPVLPDPNRATAPPAAPDQDALDVFGKRQVAYDALAMFFERSLADAAQALQAAGYEPPNLPLFRDQAGQTYYKVQLVDSSRAPALAGALGVYHSATACGDPGISAGNWFGIDAEDFVPLSSSRESFLYAVLAHELVHAIQASYPASNDALNGCHANTDDYKAVSEGTAEALSYLLARRHWAKYYLEYHRTTTSTSSAGETLEIARFNGPTGYLDETLVGLRHYDRPFLDLSTTTAAERRMAAYTTSSFWFNLMDRYGIGFVDHLLRRPLRHGDFPSLAEWLDGALRAWTPALDGLYIVFPHFAAEFASQAGSRFPLEELPDYGPGQVLEFDPVSGAQAPGRLPAGNEEWLQGWIHRVLGVCQKVVLTPGSTGAGEVRFALQRLSAACLDIRWEGFTDTFEIHLEAEHASLQLIDQVNIGLIYQRVNDETLHCYDAVQPHYAEPLWTCSHEKPFLTNGARPLTYTKRWSEPDMRFSGEGRRFIAVSNVARDARRTRPFPQDDPLVLRVGIARSEARDGRTYNPPFSPFKGMPAMGMSGFDAQAQYGITTAPTPAPMLLTFALPIAGSEGEYSVSWMGEPPALGYQGPFTGTVTAPQQPGAQSMVASMLCRKHNDGVIGRVLRFDRDQLLVDIDAELCEMSMPPPADGNFPVVDRVRARLRLPFGWQYDPATAPADIVTPGMEVFIDRHTRKVPMVLSGTWGSPGQGSGPGAPGGSAGASGSGGTGGSGGAGGGAAGTSVLGGKPCTCSCEELAAFDEAAEAAKAAGDDDATMALANEMMACMAQCQRPYMLCRAGLSDG